MGLFDFLKPKKDNLNDEMGNIFNSFFPKGEKDINAATDELLHILNNKIARDEAKNIIVKSIAISRISESFDLDRLKTHLAGYCLHLFNESQLKKYFSYLVALTAAMLVNRKTPSEVRREGDVYLW